MLLCLTFVFFYDILCLMKNKVIIMEEKMPQMIEKINRLKQEKDAVILAHYYVDDSVQQVADYIGDSYYLSKIATEIPQKVIVFCGVMFMGESAKILNPDKTVILPEMMADCPMAHMVDLHKIEKVRKEYEDLAVVCYINSTAEIKSYADVCVTSANAMKIVTNLPNKNIFFIPDENLGRYIAKQVPEKNFIFNDGYCHVHKDITVEKLLETKKKYPNALVLVHPECTMDVLEYADYIGSTTGIIDFATRSEEKEFIIATETGVFWELKQKNPNKYFYSVSKEQCCKDMKLITLEKIINSLESMSNLVELDESLRIRANQPLVRMLELAK